MSDKVASYIPPVIAKAEASPAPEAAPAEAVTEVIKISEPETPTTQE